MDRRTFMKLMGGLAAMPIVGRIAKPLKSETVQEGIASLSGKGMELYEMVIAKVMKEGKKIGESGRVDSYKHPDRPDITVDVNQTDGSAEIYFDTDKGSKGYAKIDRDMETGGTDLQEAEEIYKGTPEGDYYKDVEEGISGGLENLDEFTRIKKNIGGPVQPYDPRASTADFARAIDRVGAGTNMQKAMDIQRYDQNVQRQNMVNRIQKMNPAGTGNFLQGIKDFGQHAMVSEAMAGKTGKSVIPQYGFQTGYDFQKKFTGLDPKISAGLAAAYQTLQEGSRALNPFGDTFLRFPTAMKTATQQATENMEGILAADTGTITPEQQAARNEYLESQGQPTEPVIDQSRISEIVEQQKAAGVPDEGLVTNFNKPTMADVAGPIQDSKRENLYLKDIGIDGINDESPLNILQKYLDLNKNIKDNTVLQDYAEGARSGYLSDYIDPYAEGFNLEKDYFNNPNNLRRLAIDYDPRSGKLAYYDKNEGPYGAYKYYSGDLVDQDFVSSYGLKRFDPKDLSNFAIPQAYGPALADGGSVDLTIITMPDISGSGVESLFKTR